MIYHSFDQLAARAQAFTTRKKVAVVMAQEQHTLEAVCKARQEHIIDPLLIGHAEHIAEQLDTLGVSLAKEAIIHMENPFDAAFLAVDMINQGEADFVMKGGIHTADLMRAVVNRERGLRTGNLVSHVAFLHIPGYHKLLAITDAGIVLHPDVEEKKQIIENSVKLMRKIGYACPKVAVLAAVETVNLKMQETVDAACLKHMNQEGVLADCIVEGPISYDLSVSRESARIKGYESPVAGDADLMIVPNVTTGNLMAKALIYSAGGKMAGVIVGAKVPVVLTSRGSSTKEKFLSLILAASAA